MLIFRGVFVIYLWKKKLEWIITSAGKRQLIICATFTKFLAWLHWHRPFEALGLSIWNHHWLLRFDVWCVPTKLANDLPCCGPHGNNETLAPWSNLHIQGSVRYLNRARMERWRSLNDEFSFYSECVFGSFHFDKIICGIWQCTGGGDIWKHLLVHLHHMTHICTWTKSCWSVI